MQDPLGWGYNVGPQTIGSFLRPKIIEPFAMIQMCWLTPRPHRHVALGFVRGVGAPWLTQALSSATWRSVLVDREGSSYRHMVLGQCKTH